MLPLSMVCGALIVVIVYGALEFWRLLGYAAALEDELRWRRVTGTIRGELPAARSPRRE
jgi:hypothetical protein